MFHSKFGAYVQICFNNAFATVFYGKSNNIYHVLMGLTKYSTNVALEEKCAVWGRIYCVV